MYFYSRFITNHRLASALLACTIVVSAPLSPAFAAKKHPKAPTTLTGFTLINADNGKPIKGYDPIANGAVINLKQIKTKHLSIRANIDGKNAKSFTFKVNKKKIVTKKRPFLFKRDGAGHITDWKPASGAYTISGQAYSSKSGSKKSLKSSKTLVFSVSDSSTPTSSLPPKIGRTASSVPIPNLAQWESNMLRYGQQNCTYLGQSARDDAHLLATYYDAQRVFQQIEEYTGDSKWAACALSARRQYRDQYVTSGGGRIPGYWTFTRGLMRDWRDNGDAGSRAAVALLAQNAAWCPSTSYNNSNLQAWTVSRETAYCLQAHIDNHLINGASIADADRMLNFALGHVQQWFVTRVNAGSTQFYVKPFMAALTAEAMIYYYENIRQDSRILPAVKLIADGLPQFWVESSKSFLYISRTVAGEDASRPAPDLNLLIAPLYAWVYSQTGEQTYADWADKIFSGGVQNAYLTNGKQFNQSYRWSFDYIRWRNGR